MYVYICIYIKKNNKKYLYTHDPFKKHKASSLNVSPSFLHRCNCYPRFCVNHSLAFLCSFTTYICIPQQCTVEFFVFELYINAITWYLQFPFLLNIIKIIILICITEVHFHWCMLFPLYKHTNIYLSSLLLMDICYFLFFSIVITKT